jgi:hypothetical protein
MDKETVTKYVYQLIFEYFPTFKHFLPVLQTNLRIVCGAIFVCQLFVFFKEITLTIQIQQLGDTKITKLYQL